MINWFKSLNKNARGISCIVPLLIGGVLTILYARFHLIALLIVGIAFYVVFLFFLSLNGVVNKSTKEETERKLAENEKRLSAQAEKEGCGKAAALIAAGDIDAIRARVKELDTLMIPDTEIARCKDLLKKQEMIAQNLTFVLEKRDLLRYLVEIGEE